MTAPDAPLTVAVGGGKGGVGKSLVSANLAVAMGQLGFRVVLVDADLGAANLHTLFGIDRPGRTLAALLEREIDTLEEALVPTRTPRVMVLPGIGAVAGAANVPHAQKLKLLRHVRALEADVIVIDCGAGASFNVLDFFDSADVRICVATPQLTSLQNAYGFLKAAIYREMHKVAATPRRKELMAASTSRCETERVRDLIVTIAAEDPELAADLRHVARTFGAMIVGNQLEHEGQLNVLHALTRMLQDFLLTTPTILGALPHARRIHESVSRRIPFVQSTPTSAEARVMLSIAEQIVVTDVAALRAQRQQGPSAQDLASVMPSVVPVPRDQLPMPLSDYLRRDERIAVDWPAMVRVGDCAHAGRVVDVSGGGASLEIDVAVPSGSQLILVLPQLPGRPALRAMVRHCGTGRMGIAFSGVDARQLGEQLVVAASIPPAARAG